MFPYLRYDKNKTHLEWGQSHGEEFKTAIKELASIRRDLMLAKNPKLLTKLDELALAQWKISHQFAPLIADEIKGIAEGAQLSLTDIVILNNYTDFRDISLPEEGCSTIHVQSANSILSGQTWDMHRSAKNYMCLIHLPNQLILTLVGCVGLMGVNNQNCLIGVNNINTTRAKTGLIWPVLVRRVLQETSLADMKNVLLTAPVTSGHNYLISSPEGGMHLEVTPTVSEVVSALNKNETGAIFHTNHCLGLEVSKLEDKSSMSSTTFNRYDLLTRKTTNIQILDDLKSLLTNHDEFPKSICSHFENGAQDPSFTCGGGVSDLKTGHHIFWKGCPVHDQDFKEYEFILDNNEFKKVR
jgi:isopenicillin-N N-acyltransferase-like protein